MKKRGLTMNTKKVSLIILIFLGLSVALFTAGTARAEEPITLKWAHYGPSTGFLAEHNKWWASEVEKRTGGRLKIQMFWMSSLVKLPDMLPALQSGIADIGWTPASFWPSNLPLYSIIDNPGNCVPDYRADILAHLDTVENLPILKAELEREGILPLIPFTSGLAQLATRERYQSFLDIKGRAIRTYGSSTSEYYKLLGAKPIFMPYNDLYEAMQRGTVDGFDMALLISDGFKHYEIVKCIYLNGTMASVTSGCSIRRAAFNKLPQDIQKMLIDFRTEYGVRYGKALLDTEASIYDKWTKQYGVTVKQLTNEERIINNKTLADGRIKNIKDVEAKGHKGAQEVWDYYMASLKKYNDKFAK
jgi:TRAP-type transport system periplasmic protein